MQIRINAIIKIEVNGTVWINLFDFYKSFKSSSFLASFIAMKRYDSSSRFQYSLYYPSLTVSRFLKFDFSQLPSEGRIFSRMVHRLWYTFTYGTLSSVVRLPFLLSTVSTFFFLPMPPRRQPVACAAIHRFLGRRVVKKAGERQGLATSTPGNYYDYAWPSLELLGCHGDRW